MTMSMFDQLTLVTDKHKQHYFQHKEHANRLQQNGSTIDRHEDMFKTGDRLTETSNWFPKWKTWWYVQTCRQDDWNSYLISPIGPRTWKTTNDFVPEMMRFAIPPSNQNDLPDCFWKKRRSGRLKICRANWIQNTWSPEHCQHDWDMNWKSVQLQVLFPVL